MLGQFIQTKAEQQKGAVLIWVALGMIVFLGFAALAIDVGFLMASRNELQNAADAAALAGAGKLGDKYYNGEEYYSSWDTVVKSVAKATGEKNNVAGNYLTINEADIYIGCWNGTEFISCPLDVDPDAVHVIARRDGENSSNQISTFFGKVLGIDEIKVNAKATAALTGPPEVPPGELNLPFGLSENQFPNNCQDVISFSPTTDSCAGWHNFHDPINSSNLEDKLLGLIQGHTDCEYCEIDLLTGPDWLESNFEIKTNKEPEAEITPTTSTEDEFEFQGGTISSAFLGGYIKDGYNGNTATLYEENLEKPAPFLALFDYFRYRDGDENDSIWTATVPVYEDDTDGCINPNTSLGIVGFARVEVIMPNPPPDSTVNVKVDCDITAIDERGGGSHMYGGLKGRIPNLVE